MSDSELTEGLHRGCSFFPQPLSRHAATAPRPGSLLVQCKHIVQCRTPRGAIVSMGLRGVQGGLRGEIEIFPGPLQKYLLRIKQKLLVIGEGPRFVRRYGFERIGGVPYGGHCRHHRIAAAAGALVRAVGLVGIFQRGVQFAAGRVKFVKQCRAFAQYAHFRLGTYAYTLLVGYRFCHFALRTAHGGNYLLGGHLGHCAALYLGKLCICFKRNLVAGKHLPL